MTKEIHCCDNCQKEIEKNKMKELWLDFYYLELCEECSTKYEKAEEEISVLKEKYKKGRKKIINKYGLKIEEE